MGPVSLRNLHNVRINDVGPRDGQDIDHNLKTGFGVEPIEANSMLVNERAGRLSYAMAAGRLAIVELGFAAEKQASRKYPFGAIRPVGVDKAGLGLGRAAVTAIRVASRSNSSRDACTHGSENLSATH